jgi:hypothetical protein
MDQQPGLQKTIEIVPPTAKPGTTNWVVAVLAGTILVSIAVPALFLFGAAAAVVVAIIAAGGVWRVLDRVGKEASAKYSPATQTVVSIFVALVGIGISLVTIAMGFFAFIIAFFTAHPIRS